MREGGIVHPLARLVLGAALAALLLGCTEGEGERAAVTGVDPLPPVAERSSSPLADCSYGDGASTEAAGWLRGVLEQAGLPFEGCTGSAYVTRIGDRDLYVWAFQAPGPVEGEPNYVRLGGVEGAVVRGSTHRAVWEAQGLAIWIEAGPTSDELPDFAALAPLVAASLEIPYSSAGPPAGEGQRLAHAGIAIAVPEGWDGRVLFLDPQGRRGLLQVANFELPAQEGFEPPPELPPDEEDRITTMAGDDVLVIVAPAPRGDLLDGPAEIRAIDFFPTNAPRVPRGHALAQRSICSAGRCLRITADFGRAPVEESILAAVNGVLGTLAVAPVPPAEPEAPPDWRRHRDEENGVALAFPPSWRLVGQQLLPDLADPRAILALATFAAPPGGERCAHLPENALEAMGERDALIVLMERNGNSGYPPRPEHFGAERGYRTEAVECLERPKAFDDRLIEFEDSWRHFLAHVAFGSSASDETRGQAWAILDSLVIELSQH